MSPKLQRWLTLLFLLCACCNAAMAGSFDLQRLDAPGKLPASEVVSGQRDRDFRGVPGVDIAMTRREPQWWRIAVRSVPAGDAYPQLVITPPNQKEVEVWLPGANSAIRRTALGNDSDSRRPARSLSVPLGSHLRAGDVLYVQVFSPNLIPSHLTIETLASVHEADIAYARYRTSVLVALFLVAMLSFGYFAAMREHGYAYLGLTMLAQLTNLMIEGGEIGVVPALAEFALDRRTNIVINTAAVLTGIRFLVFFLQLQTRQPRVALVLNICSALLGGLLLVSLAYVTTFSAYFGNTVMLAAFAAIAVGIARALIRRQREAVFLLLAWAPVMTTLVVMVGGYQGWWTMPDWVPETFPAGLAFSGLALMLGLTAKLQQVRIDRDSAQRRWTYDKLTGVITRDAVGEMLRRNIEKAHQAGADLSVVFIDIDYFKSINDQYGHPAGDEALRVVALRIRNWLPDEHLVARYGGDEMLLVLVGLSQAKAEVLANALRETVTRHPVSVEGYTLPLSLSMGVADLREGDSPELLLRRADAALYRSKEEGRARVTGYRPGMEVKGI